MKRLFVAIEVPDSVKNAVAEAKAILEPELKGARWVRLENIHLTLKFLGNCQDDMVGQIAGALERSLNGSVAFTCRTSDFGAFPSTKRARVLWLGIEEKVELEAIFDHVEEGLNAIGFAREERDFQAHITVARLKQPKPVAIEEVGSKINSRHEFLVDAITLFESHLSPKGPTYEAAARIKLSRGNA